MAYPANAIFNCSCNWDIKSLDLLSIGESTIRAVAEQEPQLPQVQLQEPQLPQVQSPQLRY